ncbi:hypothetical protein CFC35_41950 [Streptomyces sp. FBKL.4005]|uniref:hypothetical protein n=1 Tax=Streptomyces sp. FBKL.4005 TaxID=2015515 RepID=UPI000B970808|nr:hypothetical protein [Streptomyces sp. FBKL.4005]OYP09982.1 hypothetical protein CFC35_41950 [Streptomyces sp. FBKL.4005]
MDQTTTDYYWVITLQAADGRQVTRDGTTSVIEGLHTRREAFTNVLQAVKANTGLPDNVTVLFFSFDKNALGGGH